MPPPPVPYLFHLPLMERLDMSIHTGRATAETLEISTKQGHEAVAALLRQAAGGGLTFFK